MVRAPERQGHGCDGDGRGRESKYTHRKAYVATAQGNLGEAVAEFTLFS